MKRIGVVKYWENDGMTVILCFNGIFCCHLNFFTYCNDVRWLEVIVICPFCLAMTGIPHGCCVLGWGCSQDSTPAALSPSSHHHHSLALCFSSLDLSHYLV